MKENHFTKMCRSPKDKPRTTTEWNRQQGQRSNGRRYTKHANDVQEEAAGLETESTQEEDDHLAHYFTAYGITLDQTQPTSDKFSFGYQSHSTEQNSENTCSS